MQQEHVKTLLVNALTAVIVGGVFIVGYFVFTNKEPAVTESVPSVAKIAEETAFISNEIDSSVRDLKGLASSVLSSKVLFDLPAFKNLQDFTVVIPAEAIGRPNPFVPTAWKLQQKISEGTTKKSAIPASGSANLQSNKQSASVSGTQTQSSAGSLGNSSSGI